MATVVLNQNKQTGPPPCKVGTMTGPPWDPWCFGFNQFNHQQMGCPGYMQFFGYRTKHVWLDDMVYIISPINMFGSITIIMWLISYPQNISSYFQWMIWFIKTDSFGDFIHIGHVEKPNDDMRLVLKNTKFSYFESLKWDDVFKATVLAGWWCNNHLEK